MTWIPWGKERKRERESSKRERKWGGGWERGGRGEIEGEWQGKKEEVEDDAT